MIGYIRTAVCFVNGGSNISQFSDLIGFNSGKRYCNLGMGGDDDGGAAPI